MPGKKTKATSFEFRIENDTFERWMCVQCSQVSYAGFNVNWIEAKGTVEYVRVGNISSPPSYQSNFFSRAFTKRDTNRWLELLLLPNALSIQNPTDCDSLFDWSRLTHEI